MGMIVGSLAGSFIASLFGAGMLSMTSIIGSTAGGILVIWVAFKIT